MAKLDAVKDYPVYEKHPELIKTPTGKPVEEVARDTERDYYMTADEALEYGIIDAVIRERQ